MTQRDVIRIVRAHVESQFPRSCSCCGLHFSNLVAFLRGTAHISTPISLDAEKGDFRPVEASGTFTLANCSCGSTLSITSDGMGLGTMWRLLRFARAETLRRKITFRQFLAEVRDGIDAEVLAEADAASAARPASPA